ncbi:MAG: TQXA domain-containing protein [Actinophytocola sp.]|uniref:thioester domain-containing protein n=1 Tax=Actinophytocola sp. TaxID=1872138 RepID=UPI00132398D5|nr:thioester domain-containing protein [Actinophytocola sp.]MPZ84848.1 TQXA domain-containing protein [Actinophytocola sp.]
MTSRFKPARTGAAVAGVAAMIMMAAAIPASAEPATGKVDRDLDVIGYQVNVGDDWLSDLNTNLIGFRLSDGTVLSMYCVEIETDIDADHEMVEQPWDAYPNADSPFHENRAEINWVLHHGYPAQSLDALAGVLPAAPNDGIDVLEAIAATQAAVWHYSDGTDLNRDDPLSGDGSDEAAAADALALYDYLTGDANVGIGDQPTPALEVDPTTLSGAAGTRIGPFTVTTTGSVDELTADLPDGVQITDADGNELAADAIENGTELYLDVPAGAVEGSGTFELTASARVDTGRLFVGRNYDEHPTQSLIVATAEESQIAVTAGAEWTATPPTTTTPGATPAPQPKNTAELAETGASVVAPIVIGVVLIGAGVGSLLFLRRRRERA